MLKLKDPLEISSGPEDAGKIVEEIKALLEELQDLYISNLKAIRVQLMVAVQKLRNVA